MAFQPDYICTLCQTPTKRELLTVKKVVFTEMGVGARTVRSRVVGWHCPRCIANDPDWNREPFRAPVPQRKQERLDDGG